MPCWSPITLKQFKRYEGVLGKGSKSVMQTVPCGRCLPCLQRKRSDWTIRILKEEQMAKSSYFVTLTYDEYNVPLTDNGNLTLDKKHLQDYIKRVRSTGNNNYLRYFAVGEYGSLDWRPHYHLLVFNGFVEDLNNKWEFGIKDFGEVNQASIHYVTKYMVQDVHQEIEWYDMQKPFRLMSKGLGKDYARDIKDYCRDNHTNIIVLPGGRKAVLPRYIADKVLREEDKQIIKENLQEAIRKAPDKSFEEDYKEKYAATLISSKLSKSKNC